MNPNVMVTVTGNPGLSPVAEQARAHPTAALDTLAGRHDPERATA